jgi:hypothetical protein
LKYASPRSVTSMSSTPPPASHPSNEQPDGEMDTGADSSSQVTWDDIPTDILSASTDEILTRIRLIENDLKVRSCLFSVFASNKISGYAVRNVTFTTRAISHEGENPG